MILYILTSISLFISLLTLILLILLVIYTIKVSDKDREFYARNIVTGQKLIIKRLEDVSLNQEV